MAESDHNAFLGRMRQIETLVQQIEQCADPATRAAAQTLAASMLELHGAAFEQLIGCVRQRSDGRQLLDSFAGDELIGSVLLLHELHPWSVERRVERAVESLNSVLGRRGGSIELIAVSSQQIHVRAITGPGGGCQSTGNTTGELIESVLRDKAPEIESIRIDGLDGGQANHSFVQLTVDQTNGSMVLQPGSEL